MHNNYYVLYIMIVTALIFYFPVNNIVSAVVDSGKIIAKTVSGAGSDGPRQSCEIDDLENLFVCIDYHSFKLDNPSVQETVSASMQLSLDGALQQLRSFSPGTTVHANITVRRSSCNPSSPTLGWPISLAFTTRNEKLIGIVCIV